MQRRTSAAVLVALSIAALSLTTAHAAPLEPDGDDHGALAIQSYAQDNGVSISIAELAITDQQALVTSINNLGTKLGVDADVWVGRQDDGRQTITVRTKNEKAKNALWKLALTEQTSLQVLDETPIAAQVPALTSAVALVVRKHAPGVQGMYVRLADGALVIETTDSLPGLDTASLSAETGFATVAVEQVEKGSDAAITTRGGVALSSCTAAFSARNGPSYIGVYSAAHCGSAQSVFTNTAGTGGSATGTRTLQVHNANADIGFYRIPTGNFVSRSFFGSSSTSATTAGSPQDVPEGISVCHRGKTSGWKCGTITSIAYQPTWSDACPGTTCNPVFVRVSAQQAGGDSGGPWVNGSSPIGIHKGGASTWSVYSKIYRVPTGTSLY